jgi:acetyl esterase/lipase
MLLRPRLVSTVAILSAAFLGLAACAKKETPTPSSETAPSALGPNASAPAEIEAPKSAPEKPTTAEDMAKLDDDMKGVMDELAALGGKPIETLTAAEARRQPTPADAVKAYLQKKDKDAKPLEMGKIEEKSFKGSQGSLPVRIYTPKSGKAPYPVVIYFHGGGFVIATNDTYDASARALANGAEAVVVSPEYRKAPEHKFPAAHDDAFATYDWVLHNAASFGGDPKRIALVGESAGGNLALNVSIAARDKKMHMPSVQVLVYPLAGFDMTTPSYVDSANAKPLDKAMMVWFTEQYFRSPADGKDPRIDLIHANLKGLPPTTIINALVDPLRSDGEILRAKLYDAGVDAEQKTYSGVTHEFFGMGAAVSKAKDAMQLAVKKIRNATTG